MQLLVVFLFAVALMAAILAAALGTGLLTLGPGGQAVISPTPGVEPTPPPGEEPTEAPAESPPATPEATLPPDETPGPEPEPTAQPTPGGVHTVRAGETLTVIAAMYGVSMQAIIEANELVNPDLLQVGQQLVIPLPPDPESEPEVHIVQSGENILGIAEQHNVDPTTLADLNGIENWNEIFVGQRLWIPGTEPEGWEPPAPSPTP
jgi:LysM repeat protein